MSFLRWNPQTGEHQVFERAEDVPPDWLTYHPDDTAKAGEGEPELFPKSDKPPKAAKPRDDGPTIEEFVKAGFPAANYPPQGYAPRSTPEEIRAAVEAEEAKKAA